MTTNFLALEEVSAGAVTSALGVASLETGGTIVSEGAEMVISSAGVGVAVETVGAKGVSGETPGFTMGAAGSVGGSTVRVMLASATETTGASCRGDV